MASGWFSFLFEIAPVDNKIQKSRHCKASFAPKFRHWANCRELSTDAVASDGDEATQILDDMRITIDALVGEPSKAEITAALRSLLEHGDVVSRHVLSYSGDQGHHASWLVC